MRTAIRTWLAATAIGALALAAGACVLFSGDDDDDSVVLPDAGSLNCPNPEFPIDCGEGDCWSSETNCSFPAYDCGGSRFRCRNATDWAACCNDTFVTCGADYPFYCPSDQRCYQSESGCAGTGCAFRAADCDGA